MADAPHILENELWQVGVLPDTGASLAFGRVRHTNEWVDVMRPTDPADYENPSKCASFIMLPWSNRIRDARFRFEGTDYELEPSGKDGRTASHGDVRGRPWQVVSADATQITLAFNSADFADINFPFAFSAQVTYRLDEDDFIMSVSLKNEDSRRMPGGFGFHPYFIRHQTGASVLVEIPCSRYFPLTDNMPTGESEPIIDAVDFRNMRPLRDQNLDHLLTGREPDVPAKLVYPAWDIEVTMHSDPLFQHMIIYTPPDERYFALEPVTNASDGFNLYDRDVSGTGVFVLEPGAEQTGMVRLHRTPEGL
jgi:aldose 1-epimerase